MFKAILFCVIAVFTVVLFSGCKEDTISSETEIPTQPSVQQPEAPESPEAPEGNEPNVTGDPDKICVPNNFKGEKFRVIDYADKVITANHEPINCRLINDRLKGEVRRGGVGGIREFVGDVRGMRGNRITIYTGKLPPLCLPKKGETLKIIWKPRKRR